MVGLNYVVVFQIGNSSGQFQFTVEGTSGQVELFHGRFQKALGRLLSLAELPHFCRRHFSVAGQTGPLEALPLPGACGHHSGLDSFRFLAQPIVSQLFIVDMRHLNKYIDPVNKRPADTPLLFGIKV